MQSWECLHFHRAKQLFLSCYVDDYKMAGKKENIAPMWASLRKEGIDLEPPVSLSENVYLGCGQKAIKPNMDIVNQKREMFQRICHSKQFGKPISSTEGDLMEKTSQGPSADDSVSNLTKKNRKRKIKQKKHPLPCFLGGTLSGLKVERFQHTHTK